MQMILPLLQVKFLQKWLTLQKLLKAKKAFDKEMKFNDPTFVGLDSPKLREWVKNASPEKRKTFIRLADSNPMQAAGMPSPAQARYAATDIIQRD